MRGLDLLLHLDDEPLAFPALDHCQRRAAGEPADEAGEDQLIEFAANYGQSLDWIVLGDLDPTIRRLYAIGTMTTIRRRWWREAALDHPVGLAAQVAGALFRGGGCRIAGQTSAQGGACCYPQCYPDAFGFIAQLAKSLIYRQ